MESKKNKWYQMSTEETLKEFSVTEAGLNQSAVDGLREKYGYNELKQKAGRSIFSMIADQFKDYMIMILLIAAVISMFSPLLAGGHVEFEEAIVIIAIVIINALIGVFQEFKAGKALEALKKMAAPNAKVIRDGEFKAIPSRELVPGDLVVLETGDYVPADVRITAVSNLKIEEAAMTGESVPVDKTTHVIEDDNPSLGDQKNIGFMSTMITYGHGKGIVVGIGMNTEIGKIAEMIQSEDDEQTPLQLKLEELGKFLGNLVLLVCGLVFVIGLFRGEDVVEMLMTAVSLAVAAIPEGLPAIVTIVLAMGMQRMVKHNSLMKRLHAVETLGSTSVICSDKTGTLTQNQMTITNMYILDNNLEVTGEGYAPVGNVTINGEKVNLDNEPAVKKLAETQAFCNDSRLENKDGNWSIIGDPTEGSMRVVAEKFGYSHAEVTANVPRIQEIPFDSSRKLMTTFHNVNDEIISYTKGAPDILIQKCKYIIKRDGEVVEFTQDMKDKVLSENKRLAQQALRVLGMAYRVNESVHDSPTPEEYELNLVFIGLVGMIDPPRAEVAPAIAKCHTAGIRVVMITGDYRDTAAAIAKNIGIIKDESQVMNGSEIDAFSDEELVDVIKNINVFARVSPEHKVRIVQAVKDNGEIVAMTGDGVNDAPALKRANIGVAMGITGTDVTKETADMILTDDNFASIVEAVEEGRVIYSNIRKFVFFLLSCNVGEVLIIFVAMLVGWNIPLLSIHLLWINLLTDSFPALALGTEKREPGLMEEQPRNPKESIIDRGMIINIVVQAIIMTIVVLIGFKYGETTYGIEYGYTFAFVTMIFSELLRAYSCRSQSISVFKIGLFKNKAMNVAIVFSFALLFIVMYVPFLRDVFQVVNFKLEYWLICGGLGILPFIFNELTKFAKKLV